MTAAVITVSDSTHRGARADASGPAVAALLKKSHFSIAATEVVPDEKAEIEAAIIRLCEVAQVVITTGGTGIAERDVTPEATRAVCPRLVDGIAERMRAEGMKKTPTAALSRGVCGIRGRTLVLNLPGSPTAAVESLESVIGILPHALDLLAGRTEHAKNRR